MKKNIVLVFLIFLIIQTMNAQRIIPLYPDNKIPNSKATKDEEATEDRDGITIVSKISKPTLAVFQPANGKATGAAVIICPGGGYWVNAISHEGTDVARKFNEMGVTAFVLKYRIPDQSTMNDKRFGPLQDVQQAIAHVRQNAKTYQVDPARIGVMGFSAGGHLASTAATHFEKPVLDFNVSVRPDFVMLIYPVISFDPAVGHMGSRDQLIGTQPSPDDVQLFSNELQITDKTPPAFLVHASDDDAVKVDNSILFYTNLIKAKVPAEIHVYQKGGHGFGMVNRYTKDLWMESLQHWLQTNGWIK